LCFFIVVQSFCGDFAPEFFYFQNITLKSVSLFLIYATRSGLMVVRKHDSEEHPTRSLQGMAVSGELLFGFKSQTNES